MFNISSTPIRAGYRLIEVVQPANGYIKIDGEIVTSKVVQTGTVVHIEVGSYGNQSSDYLNLEFRK